MRLLAAIGLIAAVAVGASAAPRIAVTAGPDRRVHVRLLASAPPTQRDTALRVDNGARSTAISVERRDEPITIALLVYGFSAWIGRDELPEDKDEPVQFFGALNPLKRAIDEVQLGHAGPTGSKGVVIMYGRHLKFLLERSSLDRLIGSWLGNQAAFRDQNGALLLPGIGLALDQLSGETTPRKALIVIGDGCDDHVGPVTVAELKRRADEGAVAMYSIVWRLRSSCDRDDLAELIPDPIRISDPGKMTEALRTVVASLPQSYELTFDGAGLPWDGREHQFELRDQDRAIATTRAVLPGALATTTERSWWLPALLGAGGLTVAATLGVLWWRRRRRSRVSAVATGLQ
jgi:hypothetical protein